MLERFYTWILQKAASPRSERWLALFGVAESSVFPIPVDIMLAPMVLARPERAKWLLINVILSTILGALIGYGIGWFFMDSVGLWLIETYNYNDALSSFQGQLKEHGLFILLFIGFTPIPYKLAAIASGALMLDPLFFLTATILAKAPRYSLQVWLLSRYGIPIRHFIKTHLRLTVIAIVAFAALALWLTI